MGKIRITTFNLDHTIFSDRLVETRQEYAVGPPLIYNKGFLRVDALLENETDLEGIITYLQQMTGMLPVLPKKERKTKTEKPLNEDSIQELINNAFTQCKTQNALIEYLRSLNFVFVTYDHLRDICEKNKWHFKLKAKKRVGDNGKKEYQPLHDNYQFMVRLLKVAKIPQNDKYDPQIFFGIRIVGNLTDKVPVYQQGKFDKTYTLEWDETKVNFKKPEKLYKFPEPMSYKERANWRAEDRKVHNNNGYEGSKFYQKWLPYITRLKPLKVKNPK